MSDIEISKIDKNINSDNYLINCYENLIRTKVVYFVFILIEILLNILQELELFIRGFKEENISKKNMGLNFVSLLTNIFDKLPTFGKLIILIFYISFVEILYYFIKIKKPKIKYIYIKIGVNCLEIFFFRTFALIFLNFFFTLEKESFLFGCLFLIPFIFLMINNFSYNHLYYFVPDFIDYPYDEFSSQFDIILFMTKLVLSCATSTTNSGFGKFCFLILFLFQIFICFYFINKSINHSYIFMKNTFINKTRLSLFISKSFIILLAVLYGKTEIITILFLIVCLCIVIIIMTYIYYIYNPFYYIKIKRETPLENTFFYLYILSEKNDFDFVLKNKIKDHYQICGFCELCQKYIKYIRKKKNFENDENEIFIKDEIEQNNKGTDNSKIDLFDIFYEGKNKYFQLIKKIVLSYKYKGMEGFTNNSYYFINLSFLIYSEYKENNYILLLNERIILEVLNKENRSFLENHESQIKQLLLCNQFMRLSNEIMTLIKDILNSDENISKAKKMIDLSLLLVKMRDPSYKNNLFSNKVENISSSKHLLIACSIIYEEIFNTALNNTQIPIRDNIQPLEDIIYNHSNKCNRLISLGIDLINQNCKIIRAGKGLSTYVNNNLFDLFPLIFKQFQINYFMTVILDNFENNTNFNANNNGIFLNRKKAIKSSTKYIKGVSKTNNKNKKDNVEIRIIICEIISSKMYYKLLTLKLSPLFNNNNNHFIIFDGLFSIQKDTIISFQDFEKSRKADEIMLAVSDPELQEKIKGLSFPFKKFSSIQNKLGYILSKISSFDISSKTYNIYILSKKESNKKYAKKNSLLKGAKSGDGDGDEEQNSENKNSEIRKMLLLEETASVSSQQANNSTSNGISSIAGRNKRKENLYEHGGFNKIQKAIYLAIGIMFLILTVEYLQLKKFQISTINNNNIFLEYREFYKLYFQLFTSTLGLVCIMQDGNCKRLINVYTNQYHMNYPQSGNFNFAKLVEIQNEILSKNIFEKKNILADLHQNIGSGTYDELFGKNIDYKRITRNANSTTIMFNITSIKMRFFETILIICNSFQILAPLSNEQIIFLNKTTDDPFYLLNHNDNNVNFNDYQKEVYEMILNYKSFYDNFNLISNKLKSLLITKSSYVEKIIYFDICSDAFMDFVIIILLYFYLICFENILIKVLNYLNMTMNVKNEEFNFVSTFLKKIENLEIILEFYNGNPINAIQNINNIYNNYQQYLNSKNKNKALDMNKKNYKKILEENELDNVPKNQRILTRNNIKKLNITFKYLFSFFVIFIFALGIFIGNIIYWYGYFNIKTNLYILIDKNASLETSVYRAINFYDLMIFNNYTMDELAKLYLDNKDKDQPNALFKTFYNDLKFAFNNKRERNEISSIYINFEDQMTFTCETLFELNNDYIELIKSNSKSADLNDIKGNLIKLCENTGIADSNDYTTVFERHFQYIRNGMSSLTDYTYPGLLEHFNSGGTISRMSLFFNCILIYLLELTNFDPHKKAVQKLLKLFVFSIRLTELIYLFFDILLINIVIFVYIKKIKNYCNQILLLRKIFKIFEIHE